MRLAVLGEISNFLQVNKLQQKQSLLVFEGGGNTKEGRKQTGQGVSYRYRDFLEVIDSEEKAIAAVGNFLYGYPERCRSCGADITRERNSTIYICRNHEKPIRFDLHREYPLLKGSRLPVRKWFEALFFIDVGKLHYPQLAERIGVSRKTAWRMEKLLTNDQGWGDSFKRSLEWFLLFKRKKVERIEFAKHPF
jgi:hypothetical protein